LQFFIINPDVFNPESTRIDYIRAVLANTQFRTLVLSDIWKTEIKMYKPVILFVVVYMCVKLGLTHSKTGCGGKYLDRQVRK